MTNTNHLTVEELVAALPQIAQSPKNNGELKLIVRRPADGHREVLENGEIDLAVGLVGDNWKTRGSRHMPDGSANPNSQVTIMNARVIALVAREKQRWPLAGDQLYVDFDLSASNIPPGTQLAIGSAVLEVTAQPHAGCKKFAERFGVECVEFVNSPAQKELQLRGINAKVIQPGTIRVGDAVRRTSRRSANFLSDDSSTAGL
jgi:MOSC domain-containing protein YiiM